MALKNDDEDVKTNEKQNMALSFGNDSRDEIRRMFKQKKPKNKGNNKSLL